MGGSTAAKREYYERNRDAVKQRASEWNRNNPEKRRQIQRTNRHRAAQQNGKGLYAMAKDRIKEKVLDLLGRQSAWCGFDDERVLQLDHVNGGGNKERKELRCQYSVYRRVLDYPSEYQILCANCNWIKRDENKETR